MDERAELVKANMTSEANIKGCYMHKRSLMASAAAGVIWV